MTLMQVMSSGGFREGVTEVTSHTPWKYWKKCALFGSRTFFVLAFLNSNLILNKNLSGQSLSLWQIYVCLLQCLVTCESHCVILWAILRVACSLKANVSCIVQSLTKTCIFLKRSIPSEGHSKILNNSTVKPDWPYL